MIKRNEKGGQIFAKNPWLKWFFGIAFLIIGFVLILPTVFTRPFIIGSLIIIGGLIIFPPTLKKIEQRLGKPISEQSQFYIVISTAIIWLFFHFNNRNEKNKAEIASSNTELTQPGLNVSTVEQQNQESNPSLTQNQDIIVYDAETGERKQVEKGNSKGNLFDNPRALTAALSQNGIGELKEWSNPMDMGWGTITDFYLFGRQNDYGLQNSIAYNLDGDENRVKKLEIILTINNPDEEKKALLFLNDLTKKTFEDISLQYPNSLSKSILKPERFDTNIDNFKISLDLQRGNIDRCTVQIIRI